jgi:5'-nucleotidase / UDP-sugar diphosphatase
VTISIYKKSILFTSFLLFSFFGFIHFNNFKSKNEKPILTLITVNDQHGWYHEDKKANVIGYEQIFNYVQYLKENNNEEILFIDAGDNLAGNSYSNFTIGKTTIDLYNEVNKNLVPVYSVLGNHEWDFGGDYLNCIVGKTKEDVCHPEPVFKNLKGESLKSNSKINYHLLANNVKRNDEPFIENIEIFKTKSGFKIGLFGLTTPETKKTSFPPNVKDYTFDDILETSKKITAKLKKDVDLIIAITHLGDNEKLSNEEKSTYLRNNDPNIDIIIDGHSHEEEIFRKTSKKALLTRVNSYSDQFAEIKLSFSKKEKEDFNFNYQLFDHEKILNKNLKNKNNNIKSILEKNKTEIDNQLNKLVKENLKLNFDLIKGERLTSFDSNLRNLITDSFLSSQNNEDVPLFSIHNPGGIRVDKISKEIPLTKKEIIDAIPFFNDLYLTKIKGNDIYKLFNNSIKSLYGKLLISGLEIYLNQNNKVEKIKEENTNQIIDNEKEYNFILNDFLYNCGDHYFDNIYTCENGFNKSKDFTPLNEVPFLKLINFISQLEQNQLNKYENIKKHYIF